MALAWVSAVLVLFSGLAGAVWFWSTSQSRAKESSSTPLSPCTPAAHGPHALASVDSFVSGLMLGAGLLHMLAESITGFEALDLGTSKDGYPLAALCAGLGVVSTVLIEGLVRRRKGTPLLVQNTSSDDAQVEVDLESSIQITKLPPVVAAVFLIALSVHSFMAGMAIGTDSDHTSATSQVAIVLVLVLHKASAALALASSFVKSDIPYQRCLAALVAFAGVTPLGIVTGIALASDLSTSSPVPAILMGYSAGTFVYISLVSIISHQLNENNLTGSRLLLFLLGFTLMGVFAIFE